MMNFSSYLATTNLDSKQAKQKSTVTWVQTAVASMLATVQSTLYSVRVSSDKPI